MEAPSPAATRRRSPALAALLSFLWPGLGQAYARRRLPAAIFTIPALALLLVALWYARQGLIVLALRFASPGTALAAFLVVLAAGAWRVAAVGHAYSVTGTSTRRHNRPEIAAFVLLLVAVVLMHTVGAYYFWSVYEFDSSVFTAAVHNNMPTPVPGATQNNAVIGTVAPVTPAPGSSRVTILLTGVDSAPGRGEHLNDTLLLVSFDTKKKTVAMISVPRDTAGFPYYWGGRAPATMKINSLATYTASGAVKSPDDPTNTLIKEIGYLVGIPVNYFATIDLNGFSGLIDKVGGVDIDNPRAINDPAYDWLDGSPYGFSLSAGKHHLNGRVALAYVRSRQGYGDSDYTRSSRQQEVLVSLEKRLTSPENMLKLPDLLKAAGSVIRTNFPSDQVAEMAAAAQGIPDSGISKYVLGPPYSLLDASPNAGTWTSCLYIDKVAVLSVQLFDKDSRYYGKTGIDPQCGS